MKLSGRMRAFLFGPDPDRDPRCSEHRRWVENYRAEPIPSHKLVFDQAQRKYAEFVEAFHTLDAKAGDLLRTSGLIATILILSLGALEIEFSWPIGFVAFWLVLAILVSLWAHWPLRHSTPPTVKDQLTDGSELEPAVFHTWFAAALHRSAEELRVVVDCKADRVRIATVCLCIGLVGLALTALFAFSKPPPRCPINRDSHDPLGSCPTVAAVAVMAAEPSAPCPTSAVAVAAPARASVRLAFVISYSDSSSAMIRKTLLSAFHRIPAAADLNPLPFALRRMEVEVEVAVLALLAAAHPSVFYPEAAVVVTEAAASGRLSCRFPPHCQVFLHSQPPDL